MYIDSESLKMLRNQEIICFAPNDWWSMNPSCTTHIARYFAKYNKVLFVNPFSSDITGGPRKGLVRRIWRKFKSVAKFLKKGGDNIYVFSPLFLPLQGRIMVDRINNLLIGWQLKIACRVAGIGSRPIVWMENPRAADLMDLFDSRLTVYQASDLFEKTGYSKAGSVSVKREQKIMGKSDLVICVSRRLYRNKCHRHGNVRYLPHGVDFWKFHKASESGDVSERLEGIPGPVAGYFGTMTHNNDIELLEYCAENLPGVSFVFAGQITGGDYSQLMGKRNVYYLGKVEYDEIPRLCAGFDVCLLQWRMSEWIRCCNPLKLFEYMASGRPIVSVPIEEVEENYSEVVSIAGNKREFCRAIEDELESDSVERKERRVAIAKGHSWARHIEIISLWMANAMAGSTRSQVCREESGAFAEAEIE